MESFFEIGENYLIRTVTMTVTGKIKAIGAQEILLSDAAWIADTGRFHNAVKDSVFSEVEPFVEDVIVGRGGLVDATKIKNLPRTQK